MIVRSQGGLWLYKISLSVYYLAAEWNYWLHLYFVMEAKWNEKLFDNHHCSISFICYSVQYQILLDEKYEALIFAKRKIFDCRNTILNLLRFLGSYFRLEYIYYSEHSSLNIHNYTNNYLKGSSITVLARMYLHSPSYSDVCSMFYMCRWVQLPPKIHFLLNLYQFVFAWMMKQLITFDSCCPWKPWVHDYMTQWTTWLLAHYTRRVRVK